MSANVTGEAICHCFNSFRRLKEGETENKTVWDERRRMMSHMDWEVDEVKRLTNAHIYNKAHKTTEGLRQREREEMRTSWFYCHFHMIKQLAIWDASNKMVQLHSSGNSQQNPSSCSASLSLTLLNLFLHCWICLLHLRILQLIRLFIICFFLSVCPSVFMYTHAYATHTLAFVCSSGNWNH